MTEPDEVVRQFWSAKAKEPSNRWTPEEMLTWEASRLRACRRPGPQRILDLGSGHGHLLSAIAAPGDQLVAVDQEPGFQGAAEQIGARFVCASAEEFAEDARFDLVLLFGVVTCVSIEREMQIYATVRDHCAAGSMAVIKNQCSRAEEFIIDGYSDRLQSRYWGRYPSIPDQVERIRECFNSVQVIEYPQQFNPWDNSQHVAFVAEGPLTS